LDLSGKVAVVTGGSRGIGRAVVQGFAEAGADVVIASRKIDSCQQAAEEVMASTGSRATAMACHVAYWDQCDQLVEAVYEEYGRCDVLVNNAGLSPLYGALEDITEEYYDKVHGVNLKGPFRLAIGFGTRMARAEGGSIINVSSTGSLRPRAHDAVYSCAKAGLNALTIALSEGLGPSVRVNCILPGPVMTDIAKAWTPEQRESVGKDAPLQRPGYPQDFVGPALWLATDASAFVTGVLIRVDGGFSRQTS
jgi:hypothetical protein